jgi:hypothetical protein
MRRARAVSVVVALALAATLHTPTPAALAQSGGTYTVDMDLSLQPTAPWFIDDIWHLGWSTETDPEPPLAGADGRLIFRDASGAITHSRLVARMTICNGHCEETSTAYAEIPAQPDAVAAELYTIDGTGAALELKATRTRSPAMPAVQILRPQPGDTLRDGDIIEWLGADADGDVLRYDLLFRPSVGFYQQLPLDVDTTATQHVFERGSLPADPNAQIAVLANDGFNTVEVTVDQLRIEGNLPPEVFVSSPRSGNRYRWGSNVILLAFAEDPEDGDVPVTWTSNLDGLLPDDPNWSTGSQGRHVLTVSAADSGGLEVSEQIVVYIGDTVANAVYLPVARQAR